MSDSAKPDERDWADELAEGYLYDEEGALVTLDIDAPSLAALLRRVRDGVKYPNIFEHGHCSSDECPCRFAEKRS